MLDTLDVDRLHEVIEYPNSRKSSSRGSGKTTATIAQLVGIVQVGKPYATIVVVTHTARWAEHITQRFSSALISEKIVHSAIQKNEICIEYNGQRFVIMASNDILNYKRAAGLQIYNYFLDMPHDHEVAYAEPVIRELNTRLI